jgi:predicted acyl esterase
MIGIVIITTLFTTFLSSIYGQPDVPGFREETFMMLTRDGVGLHTVIFYPRNMDGKKFTAIVDRSPYGYGDMEWITDIFLPFGFVAVGQDMRGTEKSQGNFTMWQSDKFDSEDLGNWIVAQEWSNGQVYTFGASADGIGSLQTPVNNPAWLGAQYIMWAPSALYDILLPHGAYKQETTEDWLLGLTMPNPDVVYDNIATVHENEAHTEYWKGVEETPEKYANVHCPSAFAAGWYDLFVMGNLNAYEGYNTMSDPNVRYTSRLTVDALGHCLDGAGFFTENLIAGQGRTALILAQLFEVYGIRPVSRSQIKNITFYVMSSNDDEGKKAGQYWTSMERWPEYKMVDFYLHADKTATRSVPTNIHDDISTSYTVDPVNPIPTVGGNNLPPDIGGSIHCGPDNQAEVDARDDVLVFETEPMEHSFAITGPLFATLYVSSDAIDTDFMVKVSDSYPTGEAILIQDNAFRMRWRENGLTPVYMEKDNVYKIVMNIWNTSWVIAPGHKLRFSIQSSNYPRFSVNPHNGLLLKDSNYPGENITAINSLYHSFKYPSHISIPHVEMSQLPEVHVLKEVQMAYPDLTEDMLQKFEIGLQKRMRSGKHRF